MLAAGLCNSKGEPAEHRIVTCLLEMRCPGEIKEERVFRSLREINIVDFKDDLRKALLSQTTDESANELLSAYNMNIKTNVAKHAPEQVKAITLRSYEPWYID